MSYFRSTWPCKTSISELIYYVIVVDAVALGGDDINVPELFPVHLFLGMHNGRWTLKLGHDEKEAPQPMQEVDRRIKGRSACKSNASRNQHGRIFVCAWPCTMHADRGTYTRIHPGTIMIKQDRERGDVSRRPFWRLTLQLWLLHEQAHCLEDN
jgi:hypothetical protein